MTTTVDMRSLLDQREGLLIPGCQDALSARQVEAAKFRAVYLSGFAATAMTGMPDLGLVGLDRMVSLALEIVATVSLPLFVDADNGHGGPIEAGMCARRFEAAGAAGMSIDDQVLPRLPSAEKTLVPIELMQDKISAAQSARINSNFLIVGRTDAMATHGAAEALRRAKALEEAGADAVMVMYLTEPDHVRTLASTIKAPLFVAITETARKSFSASDLAGAGHAATIYPVTTLLAGMAAQRRALAHLAKFGDTQALEPEMLPISHVRTLTTRRTTLS